MLDLGVGAMLHDIGKLELPERVRHREDHFTPAEPRCYEEHVAHGVAHGRKMGLSPGALAGHRAAPRACRRQRLPAAARQRPHDAGGAHRRAGQPLRQPVQPAAAGASALTPHEALSLLFAQGKQQVRHGDPRRLHPMMGVYPPGSVVQLTDDRYALVVGVNSRAR